MKDFTINNCKLINLKKSLSTGSFITPINNNVEIPFDINRVYFLYDIPKGADRGGHAHYKLQQLIIAISGSFSITIDDGHKRKKIILNNASKGLYISPGIWRDLTDFSSDSVCLVLASMNYEEIDYIRNYDSFKLFKNV